MIAKLFRRGKPARTIPEAELARVRALGCQQVQGYLFSRPLDEDAFERLLETPSLIAAQAA